VCEYLLLPVSSLSILHYYFRAVAASYDLDGGSTVLECVSPAAVNDVWWRMNLNEVGGSYVDPWGHPYNLLGVWNVDESVYQTYSPFRTRDLSTTIKDARADGFMVIRFDQTKSAKCEYYSYRTKSELIFSASLDTADSYLDAAPTQSPQGKQFRSFGAVCHRRCYEADEDENGRQQRKNAKIMSRTCASDVACKGCNVNEACTHLCNVCPDAEAAGSGSSSMFTTDDGSIGNMYGGLACLCAGRG